MMRSLLRKRLPGIPAFVLVLALCAPLAGCLVPEHYNARIKIETDGSYKVYAEGTAVHPNAWRAMRRVAAESKGGALKADELKKRQDEALAPLQKDMEQLKSDKRVLILNAIGDGRVRFGFSGSWVINRKLLIFQEMSAPLAYTTEPDGTLRIRIKDAVVTREAQALGIGTEGDLSVVLAEGIEVLEHNARKVPTSPVGAYRWHVGGAADPVPSLRLRLPAPEAASQTAPEPSAQAPQKKLAHH